MAYMCVKYVYTYVYLYTIYIWLLSSSPHYHLLFCMLFWHMCYFFHIQYFDIHAYNVIYCIHWTHTFTYAKLVHIRRLWTLTPRARLSYTNKMHWKLCLLCKKQCIQTCHYSNSTVASKLTLAAIVAISKIWKMLNKFGFGWSLTVCGQRCCWWDEWMNDELNWFIDLLPQFCTINFRTKFHMSVYFFLSISLLWYKLCALVVAPQMNNKFTYVYEWQDWIQRYILNLHLN